MTLPTTINQVPPAVLADPGGVAHKEEPLMSTDHRTDRDFDRSRITTNGTATTVKLAPRTRDVVVRGLHAYLSDSARACELHGLMPPELIEAAPGGIGSGDALGDLDVRNDVRQRARLYKALADLTASRRLRVSGGPSRFSDLQLLVAAGRIEAGRQLVAEPYEPTPAAVVLLDLDRIDEHAITLRNAVAAQIPSIELETR